jgi:putative cardiolipin synthase
MPTTDNIKRFGRVNVAYHFLILCCLLSLNSWGDVGSISDGSISDTVANICPSCLGRGESQTATLMLDRGETALYTRAWLTANAQHSIDVQYFIWSEDNIGILAAESLLQAANRGVSVRVIVDDFLIDTDAKWLSVLEAHPNIAIKIYNPKHNVGVSTFKRMTNLALHFREANQRMHDKVALFDNTIAITGGRNMADEYFDFDSEYAFRDRDVLVYGQSIPTMKASFERFWASDLSLSLSDLLKEDIALLSETDIRESHASLTQYANDPNNFTQKIRDNISHLSERFTTVMSEVRWSDAYFIYDLPGKNDGQSGLAGGGRSTAAIASLIQSAQSDILIQSPYLIMPESVIGFFKQLIDRGVSVTISTNSLASTDNLMAYSGYHNIRQALIDTGIALYEYKPAPANQQQLHQRYLDVKDSPPIFAIHAKSMVIDKKIAVIGTFNLDPRSINLNTEVGMVIPDEATALELHQLISNDIKAGNSWHITKDKNPDGEVAIGKRIKLWFLSLLPLEPAL